MLASLLQHKRTARPTALRVEALEARDVPSITAIGAAPGGGPRVQVFQNGRQVADFFAYPENFRGGVTVAVGDVNGDGFDDVVTGVGVGGGPNVKVFPGVGTRTAQTFGGVTSVTQTQTGISTTAAASFFAFGDSFTGGVQVAVGNVDPTNDFRRPVDANSGVPFGTFAPRDEIIVAPLQNGGPNVKVFGNTAAAPTLPAGLTTPNPVPADAVDLVNGLQFGATMTERSSFFAFTDPNYRGGLNLAVGNVNAFPTTVSTFPNGNGQAVFQVDALPGVDNFEDIVIGAGETGSPRVVVLRNLSTQDQGTGAVTYGGFDGARTLADFFAYDSSFRGGVYVDVGDQNGDGVPDIITGVGPGGGPNVRVFTANTTALTLTNPPFSSTTLPASLTTPYGASVSLFPANTFDTLTGPISNVLLYNGINATAPYASFFAADNTYSGGVKVRNAGVGQIVTSYGSGFPTVTRQYTSDPATFPTTAPTTFQARPSSFVPLSGGRGSLGSAVAPGTQVFDPQFTGGVFIDSTEF